MATTIPHNHAHDTHDGSPWPEMAEAPRTDHADRRRFRQVLSELAEKAKVKLPESAGRIDSAVKIVLAGDVEGQQEDGSWRVGSCTDPLVTHRVQGTSCSCDDSQYGKAPGGFCKHILSVILLRRANEVLESEAPPAALTAESVVLPEPNMVAAHLLPEAPASLNFRAMVGGFETQITLRDASEHRLLERLGSLLASGKVQPLPTRTPPQPLSPQQHNAMAGGKTMPGYCKVHGVEIILNTGKDGRQWYSHRTDDGFCKGR